VHLTGRLPPHPVADGPGQLRTNVSPAPSTVAPQGPSATTVEIPSSHVAMVSHPADVADLIKTAAEAVGAAESL
jgi:hypothetical protein